jgi:hypothetical protein
MSRRCAASLLAVLFAASSCQSGGVGDPCVPEDEYQTFFPGYALTELNIESRSFQCETRLCLVNHFQGRVSCPYGQSLGGGAAPRCHIPGSSRPDGAVRVDVKPGLTNRRAEHAVYCSCRCNGPDTFGRYCRCPTGFTCTELLHDIRVGSPELAGSYCIRAGTEYDNFTFTPAEPCDRSKGNCGSDGDPLL